MDTVTIPKGEYEFLNRCKKILKVIETAIHSPDDFQDLTILSERTAIDLWDNEYDKVWDKV